jgi:threonine/homoserine/homoserine lactone efflux protein
MMSYNLSMINTTIISFFGVSLLLALMPGPDNIFLITQSTIQGKKAGLALAAGLCAGLLFHTAAVALGVAAALKTYPLAFTVIKFSGASYLIYLAWMSFKTSSHIRNSEVKHVELSKLFSRGVIMNITNPKVSIFFLAFLPQFVVPANGGVSWQLINLGLIFILATAIVFSILSVIAGTIGTRILNSDKSLSLMNKVGGVVFIILAAKLLL